MKCIRLLVSNEGETIDSNHLDHIFEPYNRAGRDPADPASVGGLHICKVIADEHGGHIQISSDNGQTEVQIDFPLMEDERGRQ